MQTEIKKQVKKNYSVKSVSIPNSTIKKLKKLKKFYNTAHDSYVITRAIERTHDSVFSISTDSGQEISIQLNKES